MNAWVLILFAYVGPFGHGNSNAITSVPGFYSQDLCKKAGQQAAAMADGTVKEIRFVCVNVRE